MKNIENKSLWALIFFAKIKFCVQKCEIAVRNGKNQLRKVKKYFDKDKIAVQNRNLQKNCKKTDISYCIFFTLDYNNNCN